MNQTDDQKAEQLRARIRAAAAALGLAKANYESTRQEEDVALADLIESGPDLFDAHVFRHARAIERTHQAYREYREQDAMYCCLLIVYGVPLKQLLRT